MVEYDAYCVTCSDAQSGVSGNAPSMGELRSLTYTVAV